MPKGAGSIPVRLCPFYALYLMKINDGLYVEVFEVGTVCKVGVAYWALVPVIATVWQ